MRSLKCRPITTSPYYSSTLNQTLFMETYIMVCWHRYTSLPYSNLLYGKLYWHFQLAGRKMMPS